MTGSTCKVTYLFANTDGVAFSAHGEELNLAILRTLHDLGIQIARPTSTLQWNAPTGATPLSSGPSSP